MKKISILVMAFIVSLSFVMFGCQDKTDKTEIIRVNEVTHSIFYAPFYVAINNGYFKDEGFLIKLTNGGGADKSMTALISKDADIGLMGPEAAVYVAEGGAKDKPVVFGQLTKRDGSFIVSKTKIDNFTLECLKGKEIIGGRKGGMPAMTLQYAIEQKGLKIGEGIDKVNLRTDVAFNLTASVFDSTSAEFCTLFEPTASELCKEKGYHIVASVGEVSGEVPYTAFMARNEYINENPLRVERFLRAVYRGYLFLKQASVDEIKSSLKPSFTDAKEDSIVTSIKSYIKSDAWVDSPVLKEETFSRLQDIMINAKELKQKVKYSDIVDTKIARKVYSYFNF